MTLRSLVTGALDVIRDVGGETITYSNGSGTVSLTCAVARTEFETVDMNGITERVEMRDFLVVASDLVISGSAVTPSRGHTITWDSGTYELMSPGREPVHEHVDQHAYMFRIHTKRTA